MAVRIVAFGKAAEALGRNEMELDGIASTKELEDFLSEKYPLFKTLPYRIAVNRAIAGTHVTLNGNEEIALLPPFSGG